MNKRTEKQYRDKSFIAKAKASAEKVITINGIQELKKHLSGMALMIAPVMVKEYGWYGYTQTETGKKVFIELV